MGIKLVNVSHAYKRGRHSFPVFHQVNFAFPARGLVCILGKSGSGKTTLLDLIAGFLKPQKGKVSVNKYQRFAFVFQDGALIDTLSVKDNIGLGLTLTGQPPKAQAKVIKPLAQKVKVEHLIAKDAQDLSGGEKIRAALVRALALEDAFILADEPTGALDSANARTVMELLQAEGQKRLVICVTHNEDLAHTYADYVAIVGNGQIRWQTEPPPVAFNETIRLSKKVSKIINPGSAFKLSLQMLKRQKGRLLLSSLTIGFAFAALTEVIAIGLNAPQEAERLTNSYYANDVVYLAETVLVKQGQGMKLTRQEELSAKARQEASKLAAKLYPSLAFFVPRSANWYQGVTKLSLAFEPSFANKPLFSGHWPTLPGECIVNQALCAALNKSPTAVSGLVIPLQVQQEIALTVDETPIKGSFAHDWHFQVTGVAAEENIFNYPTVYYPYLDAFATLQDQTINDKDALTLGDILTEKEFKNTAVRSYETVALTNDARRMQRHFKKKNNLKVAVTSKALAGQESIDGIITSVSDIVIIFLSLAALVAFCLEVVCLASICLENRRNYAIVMAFATQKGAFTRFAGQLVNIFAVGSTFFFIVFIWLLKFGAGKILGNMGFGATLGHIAPRLLGLSLLGMYFFAALATFEPLHSLTKAKLASALRSER